MSLPREHPVSVPVAAPQALAGRVVLVTGAAGGLGGAVARAAAAAGASVVLSDHKVPPLERLYDELVATGAAQPAILPVDLIGATPTQYGELVDNIRGELGRLDGVVHAAAHFDTLTPIAHHKPDEWLRTMQVNLSAPFALTQACLPLLTAAPDSAVVFLTDDPDNMDAAHWGAYGVAKAGVERLASILHDENDRGSLRVHLLLPAPMRTPLRRKAWMGEDPTVNPTPETTAAVVVGLLSAAGAPWRGKLLDLRPLHATD